MEVSGKAKTMKHFSGIGLFLALLFGLAVSAPVTGKLL